jgi:hypothetical protein
VDWDGTLAVWREVSCEETDCTVNLHDHADFLCLNETLPLVCHRLTSFAWIWLTLNKKRKHSPPPIRVHVYRANPSDYRDNFTNETKHGESAGARARRKRWCTSHKGRYPGRK